MKLNNEFYDPRKSALIHVLTTLTKTSVFLKLKLIVKIYYAQVVLEGPKL